MSLRERPEQQDEGGFVPECVDEFQLCSVTRKLRRLLLTLDMEI